MPTAINLVKVAVIAIVVTSVGCFMPTHAIIATDVGIVTAAVMIGLFRLVAVMNMFG